MQLTDVFLGLGEDNLNHSLRHVSLGKLKTYQLFDRIKTRLRVPKLNQEALRKVGPRIWERLQQNEPELAVDLSQAILISHLDMIVAVLDFVGVPHNDGFFDKDAEVAQYLTDGWQDRVFQQFREKHPEAVLLFYLNHLAHEVNPETPLYAGSK